MTIYDETNAHVLVGESVVVNGQKVCRGRMPRNWQTQPFGSLGFAKPFDLPLIPRSEWDARIEEQEATKSSLHHLCKALKIPVKNQQQTNYCWINAPVFCVEVQRAFQGNSYVELSPASCGAIIKNYSNVGGWGTEGIEFIVQNGIAPASLWPCNAISRRYNTAEVQNERQKYRITEWFELQPNSFDELVSALLRNIPIAIGLSWWGHEVTALRAIKTGSRSYGIIIANSWGQDWEDDGFGVLSENKGTPDDAIGPTSVYSTSAA